MGDGCVGFLVIGASGVYAELVSWVVAAGRREIGTLACVGERCEG